MRNSEIKASQAEGQTNGEGEEWTELDSQDIPEEVGVY